MPSKGVPNTRKLNKFSYGVSTSSRSPHESSIRLTFPEIYNSWFKGKEELKIEEIQHRKEFDRPFFHEFVLVRFDDGSQYRFDRRPDGTQPIDALRRPGSEAYDTVELVTDIESPPHARSECIAALDFKDNCVAGLSLILAVCSAISQDERAYRYTLQEFNCYFFSWTIIATVARYCVAWKRLPYDSSALCLPGARLSQPFVQGIMDELAGGLPHSLSSALLIALPEMLSINVPDNALAPPEWADSLCNNYSQRLTASLNAVPFKTKLSQILRGQSEVIDQTLNSPSNREELQDAIKSIILEANPQNYLDRKGLSILLQRLLWQGDITLLSSQLDSWISRWCTLENTDNIMGGPGTWELISNIIIEWISKAIQGSASSLIAKQIEAEARGILGVEVSSSLQVAPHEASSSPTTPSILNVIDASILIITECNVRHAVSQVRKHMKASRTAIRNSVTHAIENLFPDELPIGLRIPKAQNSPLRRLLWCARPESAFCLWRTPRVIHNCDSVKHRELQKYLSRRIHAHSRDVRFFGVGSGEVEMSIREAMTRVWLTGSKEIEGLETYYDENHLGGYIELLSPTYPRITRLGSDHS